MSSGRNGIRTKIENNMYAISNNVSVDGNLFKMVNLNVNGLVLSYNKEYRIKNIYPIESRPVYRIKTKLGYQIDITSDQLFPTSYGRLKSLKSGLSISDSLFIKK